MSAVSARARRAFLIVLASLMVPASAYAQIGSTCLRPLAIPDRWEEQQTAPWDPQDTFSRYDHQQGQVLANPDVYRPPDDPSPTGYNADTDQGRLIQFSMGFPGNLATPSRAFPVAIGPTGGSNFLNHILQCAGVPVAPGDRLDAEAGNLLGPFRQGFGDLIAQDPDAQWDPTANGGRGGVVQSAYTFSPRLIGLPAFDPDVYDQGLAIGIVDLKVVRVVGFFVSAITTPDNVTIVVQGYLTGASTLTTEPVSITFGDTGTLAATLQAPGWPLTGVPIEFALDGASLGSALTDVDGRALLSGVEFPGRSAGVYPGAISGSLGLESGFFFADSNAASLIVAKAPSSVTLSTSSNSSVVGQVVTLTATVIASAEPPAGLVTFFDGAQAIGSATIDPAGAAVFSASSLGLGSHQLSGRYDGSTNLAISTSAAIPHSVSAASTTTTLSSSANPSRSGESIVLTARVNVVAPGSGVPSGSVDFFKGNQLLTTIPLANGVASLNPGPLANGKIRFTARYNGTASYTTSTSPELTQTVQKK